MKDGKPWLSFGVMGGDHQAQGHTQVLVNLIDFGMNVQEAGEAARVNHGNRGLSWSRALFGRGAGRPRAARPRCGADHRRGYGGFQGILIDPRSGVFMGGSDPRKDGLAIGY